MRALGMRASVVSAGFWVCAVVLFYTYVGYALMLVALGRRRGTDPPPAGAWPTVSVVVAACNEEHCIADKIRNTFASDYPPELLQCVVVSDGSTDRTVMAARAASDDERLVVVALPRNRGKCLALNHAVERATGEVLVFTDANAMLASDALRRLVAPFADARVGLVSGKGVFVEADGDGVHVISSTYLEYERFLREREQRFGYIAWADGALYALRRTLFSSLAPMHANDFLHPIQAVLQGYRVVFEPAAIFREATTGSAGGEFRRQARMIAQGMWILATEGPKLVARRRWTVLWQLGSHRLLRWMGPVFLAGALAASGTLAPTSAFFRFAFAGQLAFYGVAVVGAVSALRGWRPRGLAVPYYFCLVNLAGLIGFLRVITGHVQAAWTPMRPD